MTCDDTFHQCQAYSRTFKIAGGMQPLEYLKQPVYMLHIKPYSIIFDIVDSFYLSINAADLYFRPLILT